MTYIGSRHHEIRRLLNERGGTLSPKAQDGRSQTVPLRPRSLNGPDTLEGPDGAPFLASGSSSVARTRSPLVRRSWVRRNRTRGLPRSFFLARTWTPW